MWPDSYLSAYHTRMPHRPIVPYAIRKGAVVGDAYPWQALARVKGRWHVIGRAKDCESMIAFLARYLAERPRRAYALGRR